MGFSQHFTRRETFSQTRVQVGQVIPVFTNRVEMDCYTNNFPDIPCFKQLTADKHVLAELLLVPFVIINLTRLTVGVCMKVRFKSKVTRGFSFSPLRDLCSPLCSSLCLMRRKIKKNLWDQGKSRSSLERLCVGLLTNWATFSNFLEYVASQMRHTA